MIAVFERSKAVSSAALCALLLASTPAFGNDATGVVHSTCGFPFRYLIELTKYRGHPLTEPIRFKILGDVMSPNQWLDEQGMECGQADPCAGYFSRIQVLHVSHGGILKMSGNVTLILDGGRKLQGPFTARYVKPSQQLICE